MIDHKSSIGKFLKNWNYFKYTFWPHAIRLGIISGKKTIKNTNTWRLNHMLLKNENATKEPKEEKKKKYLGANENENVTTQNLSDAVKAG